MDTLWESVVDECDDHYLNLIGVFRLGENRVKRLYKSNLLYLSNSFLTLPGRNGNLSREDLQI